MSQTKAGSEKAVRTIYERHGKDFFKRAGEKGGSVFGVKKGFAATVVGKDGLTGKERAAKVGRVGGTKSRRKPNYIINEPIEDKTWFEKLVGK